MAHSDPGPHRYLVWLDRSRFDRALVGGKGASLSLLASLGAPVPRAVALTTQAYDDLASHLSLPDRAADVQESELEALRSAILTEKLPDSIAEAMTLAYQQFESPPGQHPSLAVRSSATAEDSASFSFAGLHDTVLGVRSLAALESSIRQCWASMWSDRAMEYRRAGNLASDHATIAVVIQEMIRADVSFVMFTADPVTDRDDRLVIAASWGLGEAVVSGVVTPDHIVVNTSGEIVEYVIGHKEHMVIDEVPPLEGARQVPVPRALRDLRALSDEQVRDIASVGRMLSGRLGYEADLEGGIADGTIYLFQARPITTHRASIISAKNAGP
jgi:pyruvate,water dikinase